MKRLRSLFVLLALLCITAKVQSAADSFTFPTHTFRADKLTKWRTRIWHEWQNFQHRQVAQPKLPALSPLAEATPSAWILPDTLEPHATMPFYWGAKGEKPADGYPLFIYLHGSGPKEREWRTGLALAREFADSPSVYFVPQIPNEGSWYRWWQRSKQWAWSNLLREALQNPDINPRRIYLLGISEGGYGSQRLGSFYADYLAAVGPMAGGEPLKNAPAENLCCTAFNFRTGAWDGTFFRNRLTAYTAAALDSLAERYPSQFTHQVELCAGRGHAIDYFPTAPWLARYTRQTHPKHFVWEDFEMDGLHRKGFYNLLIDRRPCDTLRTRYEMEITGNNIAFTIQNVHYTTTEKDAATGIELKFSRRYETASSGKLTLFLDEKLVDLGQAVSVSVNGKQVFRGKLTLSTAHLLHSLTTFYDPERLYPTAVDISY